ncbi:AWPM-19-like [Macleaya cordata]|uniref:AWPM-19-like n=1 Tax=Macleaya cordata TaxID=56857 RepID=A0A200RBK6_MACCD|nr:AWPM-19-like [Macleaya cordata]
MAAGAAKSLAFFLLFINLVMYGIVSIIAGWALQYGINHTYEKASTLVMPAHLFPIYFPIGNMATGFFVMFSLIAGLVGIATSISGINSILQWNAPNLLSAATTSIITWSLTLLAMGLACKEINIGDRGSNLRALETFTFILSGTQLVCMGAIHAGVKDVIH